MRGFRDSARLRALGALLIALALVAGGVDLHVLGDGDHGHHDHHALDLRQAGEGHFHVAESHPDQPTHVESSVVHEHPHCNTCLMRLHGPSSELDPDVGVPTLVVIHPVRMPEPPAGESRAARWISARAPPHLV